MLRSVILIDVRKISKGNCKKRIDFFETRTFQFQDSQDQERQLPQFSTFFSFQKKRRCSRIAWNVQTATTIYCLYKSGKKELRVFYNKFERRKEFAWKEPRTGRFDSPRSDNEIILFFTSYLRQGGSNKTEEERGLRNACFPSFSSHPGSK